MSKSKAMLLSVWDEAMDDVGRLTTPGKAKWAAMNGYDFRLTCEKEKFYPWRKAEAIRSWMETVDHKSWVIWMDADAAVTNPHKGVPLYFWSLQTDLLFACDVNGLNSGVMFWRVSDWSLDFAARWLAVGRERFGHYPNPEQTALAYLLYREPSVKWAVLPQRACNSYRHAEYGLTHPEGEWQPGDFVLHLPAMPNRRRREIFKEVLGG